jgi:hypothetical protein
MEEKAKLPGGFLDKWMVDQDVRTPFSEEEQTEIIQVYPYEDQKSKGYIRYVIRGRQMIIIDCLVVEYKEKEE